MFDHNPQDVFTRAKRPLNLIDQRQLKELFEISPATGLFVRRDHPNSPVGTLSSDGYIRVVTAGHYYSASRLMWLYHYGSYPRSRLRYRDGKRTNYAWDNLYTEVSKRPRKNRKRDL